MLRDRLVCGVRDEVLQRRLLAETALDLKKAYEKAVAAEYATRQTTAIRRALPAASDLHRMDEAPKGHKPADFDGSGLLICLFDCQLKDIEQAGNLEEGAPTVFPGSADTQQTVWVEGVVEVPVKYNGREGELPLLVTKGCGISTLGID
ncbi:hypothetical protein MTO96_029062 [Rhipicephalus appendiculatus]